MRLKGNSTFNHPNDKKAFKIDFNKYVSGQNYDGLKKLNFSNGFKDPSFLREKVFFDLCQDAGVPAPRANFANVYFNGTLWGFYTVVEQIDDQFLDWRIGDDDGNLFKAGDNFGGGPGGGGAAADLVDYGANQSNYEERYELKSNEDENDWTDLIEFIDFINNASDADFENEIADKLEWTEYLRSAALNSMFSNLDSYTGSARNYYLYHNMTSDKWEWIKWDGNECFGSYGAGGPGGGLNMTTLALNHHDNNRPLLERIFENENLYNQYLSEVCYLKANFFNSDYINARIDILKPLIQASVYADNNKMYSNADFDTNTESNISGGGGPGGGTTYGLKSFVQEKHNYLNGVVDCSVGLNETEINQIYAIYPNPANTNIALAWQDNSVQSLVIFNILGEKMYEETTKDETRTNIDVSSFANGLYFVQFFTEKGNQTKELVISK